jgi:hypothetical protein
MGVVDLATDGEGRQVALKRLPLHGDPVTVARARARARREAEVLGTLRHPAVLGLLEVLDDGDDVVLVLPFLPGGSLADRVAATGPLEPDAALALARRLLGGLAAAHRAGVVHRDVTPANVLLDAEGEAVLSDFGVATTTGATAGLTAAGDLVGTPAYMAPEQAAGGRIGPPADVFGLGATLRWAVTGEGPYGSGSARVLFHRAAAGRVLPVPRRVPAELRRLLDAMLDPDPARRPSAAELLGGAGGTAMGARPAPLAATAVLGRLLGPGARRRRRSVLLGTAAAALLVIAGVALAGRGSDSTGAAAPAGGPAPAPCTPLPYQPCGGPVAPGTDGHRCVDGRADYDGDAADGCEAVPDGLDGTTLDGVLRANLVPADDVDRYRLDVDDRPQLLCDGTLRVTLTAPAGTSQRVEVRGDGTLLGEAGSTDGFPATVALEDPSCGRDDSGRLEVAVRSIGDARSSAPYHLEARGSW